MSTMIEPTGRPMLPVENQYNSNRFTIWTRLLWKDFRQLLPIWLTILFGAALSLFLVNLNALTGGRYGDGYRLSTLVCCQGFAVLVCLINGVLLFALERENRTHQLLHGLSLHPRQVLWSKIVVGLVGSFAMIVILAWAGGWVTYMASGTVPKTGLLLADNSGRQAILIIGPVAFFLIGVCAALLAGATFNAFAIATFFILLAAFVTTYIGVDPKLYRGQPLTDAAAVLGTVVIMMSVVVWNAQRWVEGRPLNFRFRSASGQSAVAEDQVYEAKPRKPRQSFPVLMWQSWRIALPKIGLWLYATVVIYLSVLFELITLDEPLNLVAGTALFTLTSLVVGISLLFCATIFHTDHQSQHYRFFQQHVERPRWFWLTRLTPWVLAVFLIVTCCMGVLGIYRNSLLTALALGGQSTPDKFFRHVLVNAGEFVAIGALMVLAIGQFWSMFVRNFVIAIVFTVITGAISFWCIGWLIFMGESLTVFVLPLVVALFWATWYRARFWLADDRRWRGYVVPISTSVATIGLLLAGFDYHRANEIPEPRIDLNNIASAFSEEEEGHRPTMLQFGTAEERANTANLYRQALSQLKGNQLVGQINGIKPSSFSIIHAPHYGVVSRELVLERSDTIELLLKASEQTGCEPFLDAKSPAERFGQAEHLHNLMMAYALVCLEDEKIDEALKAIEAYDRGRQRMSLECHYLFDDQRGAYVSELLIRWSELPGQTVETLRPVIRRLEYTVDELARTDVQMSPQFGGQPGVNIGWFNYRNWGGEREWFTLIYQFREIDDASKEKLSTLPWLGKVFYKASEQRANRLRKQLALDIFRNRYGYTSHNRTNFGINWRNSDELWKPISHISDADQRVYGLYDSFYYKLPVIEETLRRYTLVRLALMAHFAEHGQYPKTLDALSTYFQPNQFQTAIPKTAVGGQDFAWFSDGLPEKVFQGRRDSIEIEPNRPVLFPFAVDQPIDFTKTEEFEFKEDRKDVSKRGTRLPIASGTQLVRISSIYLPDK